MCSHTLIAKKQRIYATVRGERQQVLDTSRSVNPECRKPGGRSEALARLDPNCGARARADSGAVARALQSEAGLRCSTVQVSFDATVPALPRSPSGISR